MIKNEFKDKLRDFQDKLTNESKRRTVTVYQYREK